MVNTNMLGVDDMETIYVKMIKPGLQEYWFFYYRDKDDDAYEISIKFAITNIWYRLDNNFIANKLANDTSVREWLFKVNDIYDFNEVTQAILLNPHLPTGLGDWVKAEMAKVQNDTAAKTEMQEQTTQTCAKNTQIDCTCATSYLMRCGCPRVRGDGVCVDKDPLFEDYNNGR